MGEFKHDWKWRNTTYPATPGPTAVAALKMAMKATSAAPADAEVWPWSTVSTMPMPTVVQHGLSVICNEWNG
jgi:hypothetical protein